jgi:hypothetical protein
MRPSKRLLVVTALAAVLAVAVGVALSAGGGKSNAAAPRAIQGTATATVQRRDLVETDIQTGTLGYCGSLNVYGRLAGTVTWLPSAGSIVQPDHALYGVEGSGVYLLDGTQPVRRAFRTGMSDGADVAQLNSDLRTMGYDPGHEIELGDHFSEATKAAVKRWQDAHGLERTGEIEFGRIVFQPGARRVEKTYLSLGGSATPQASSSAQATTETAAACRRAPGRAAAASNAAYRAPALPGTVIDTTRSGAARMETVAFTQPAASSAPTTTTPSTPTATAPRTTPTTSAPTTPAPPAPTTTGTAPKSPGGSRSGGSTSKGTESSKPQSGGGTGGSGAAGAKGAGAGTGSTAATPSSTSASPFSTSAAGGTQGSSPGVALVTTSLQRVVTVSLEASKQSEARIGEAVQVTLPSNEVISGHIAGVTPAATLSSGSGSSGSSTPSTVSVEVTLDSKVRGGGLDQAPVSVAFATQRQNNALSIPVTALVATASGGYAVEQVQGTRRSLVPVTPGIYAGGFVAVSGVPEGTLVTNASQ